MIQRSLKGYTKSFVNKDESITSEKVKRNASFEDYFALKSQIKGKINTWDLEHLKEKIYKINEIEALVKNNSKNSLNIISNFIVNYQ